MKVKTKPHWKAWVSALMTGLGVLVTMFALENSENQRFQEQKRADVLQQLSTVRARLEGEINSQLLLTEVFVSYTSKNPNITQNEFAQIAAPLLVRYPGIRSINLAKNSVISHIYPLKGNEKAIGLNLAATPEQQDAVERTIESKQSIIAGPVNLVQGGIAFINRAPIFTTLPNSTSNQPVYWGLASVVVNSDVIYQKAGLLDQSAKLNYVLRGRDGLGEKGEIFFGDPDIFKHKPVRLSVTLPNGSWQLAAIPKGGWLFHSPIALWFRIGSVCIALIAGSLVFILASEPARLELAVEQATVALRQNEQQLKQANDELQQTQKQIDDYNRNLEQQVAQRTQELSQTLQELITTQDELVQSEKMAALGQLVAGVAHEINTPLAVIRSSVSYINEFLHENLAQFPALFREFTPEREQQFQELLERSLSNPTALSGRERRQLRQSLIHQLEAQDIDNAETIAYLFLDLNIYDNLEPFFSLLREAGSEDFLTTVSYFARLKQSTRNINTASEMAAKVVFALKTYARYDQSSQPINANIIDGLEAVLTLYQNQLKQGVQLVREYEKLPTILCYFDELNQVWTNLIHNALQAMGNKGTLKVRAIQNPGGIEVTITDSGKGIPPEIQDKIFQPFFTTKPPGEGTGLGLDIVRKIVQKHQGRISFNSRPGETSFTVYLPF